MFVNSRQHDNVKKLTKSSLTENIASKQIVGQITISGIKTRGEGGGQAGAMEAAFSAKETDSVPTKCLGTFHTDDSLAFQSKRAEEDFPYKRTL